MPMNESILTAVVVASAVVTIVSTFSSASAAICMVYRIFRPENEAPALAPRLGRPDLLPPPIQQRRSPSQDGGGSGVSSILPRMHGFFRGHGTFADTSPTQILSMMAAICHLISATTSLMSASSTVRRYWRRWARRDGPRRTLRVSGPAPTFTTVATSPISSATSLQSDFPQPSRAPHLLRLKDAIESAISYSNEGVQVRLGPLNCDKVGCKSVRVRDKLATMYGNYTSESDSRFHRHRQIVNEVLEVAGGALHDDELDKEIREYTDRARRFMDDTLDTANMIKDIQKYDDFTVMLRDKSRLALSAHDAIRTIHEGDEEPENNDENIDSQNTDFNKPGASGYAKKIIHTFEVSQQMGEYMQKTVGGYIDQIKSQTHIFAKSTEKFLHRYDETSIEEITESDHQGSAPKESRQHENIEDNAWGISRDIFPESISKTEGEYTRRAEEFKDKAYGTVKRVENAIQKFKDTVQETITGTENQGAPQKKRSQHENIEDNAWGMAQDIFPESDGKSVGKYIQQVDEFKDKAHSIAKSEENVLQKYENMVEETFKGTENHGAPQKKRSQHENIKDNAWGMIQNILPESVSKTVGEYMQRAEEFKDKTHDIVQRAEIALKEYGEKAVESFKGTENQGAIKKVKRNLQTDDNGWEMAGSSLDETLSRQLWNTSECSEELTDNALSIVKSADNASEEYEDNAQEIIERSQNIHDSKKSEVKKILDQMKDGNISETSGETSQGSQDKRQKKEYMKYATEIKEKAYDVVRTIDELLEQNDGARSRRQRRRRSTRRSLSVASDKRTIKEWREDTQKVIVCSPQCDRECSRRETRKDSGIQTSVSTSDVGCSPSSCDKICYTCPLFETAHPNPYKMKGAKINIETTSDNIDVILKEIAKKSLIVIKKKTWPNRSDCLLHKRKEEAKSSESIRPESAGGRKREVGPKRRSVCRNCKNEATCLASNCRTDSSHSVERKRVRFSENREFVSEHSKIWGRHTNHLSDSNQRPTMAVREIARESIQYIEAGNEFQGINNDAWFMNNTAPITRSIIRKSDNQLYGNPDGNYIGAPPKFNDHGKCLTSSGIDRNRNTVSSIEEKIHHTNQYHQIVSSQDHEIEVKSNRHQINIPDDPYVYQQFPQTVEKGKREIKFVQETTPALISNVKRTLKTPDGDDIIVTATYSCKEAVSRRKNNEVNTTTKKGFDVCANVDQSELALSSPSQPTNEETHTYLRKKVVISKKRCQGSKLDWGKKYSDRFKHLLGKVETRSLLNKNAAVVDKELQRVEGLDTSANSAPINSKHRSCEVIWQRDCKPNSPIQSAIEVDFTHDNQENKFLKNCRAKRTQDSPNPKYDSEMFEPVTGRLAALHLVIPPKLNDRYYRVKCKARPHHSK